MRDRNSTTERTTVTKLAMTVHILVGLLLLGVATAAAAAAASHHEAGFSDRAPRIAFTDPAGAGIQVPSLGIGPAYPGMRPAVSTFTLKNTGEVRETFMVSTRTATAERSLDDVLVAKVIESRTNDVMFSGHLSDLAFDGPAIAAGETAGYEVRISWPDGGNADSYQGLGISFRLAAHAVEA